MQLAVIVVPVSDVDRAMAFYRSVGFHVDLDHAPNAGFRVVRLTPPGSAAAIVIGTGITAAPPGSVGGLHLLVPDIEAARAELVGRGIDVGEVFHDTGGVFYHASPLSEVPGPDPAGRAFASFARFSDPDGNGWVLQHAPGPVVTTGAKRSGSAQTGRHTQ
jgi:catechol 2,3-dioxygenase-like lactoylglutathione lyase family enzyme